ncbi:VWA domain-containing protein [Pseudoalteromonas sp. BDTF-M6]|uniref:VWA domain-containing protein n=1 Tax=Pseudoalteromonas sp. BDTF-M6 TaxID=2796132 RepID=UPI001BB045DC|nr:VWA domain-containing protein [Pseudoalteromonas sp. BDTF-M6]MBS3798853.1 VWA domain-containing protein [Pseudoalteromonas sp. BDTF-M6]
MTEFIFLRPDLLWLLLLPGFYLIWRLVASKDEQQQQPLIAPHLAAQVMQEGAEQRQNNGLLNALLLALMVVAMAGPSFSKQELPVYEAKMARVMVMDMSRSMFSTDISPNRLQQARFKALDMVELFKEGETALIAYAGDAFTISPLTSDSQTLTNLIPSLSPDIMPEQGSNVLAALTLAQELLEQADYPQGDIILISDGIDAEEEGDIRTWLSNNDYRLHIYAIGSEQGAPISLPDGGFLKDNQGQIVIPKTNFERLQRLAQLGGGKLIRYQPSSDNLNVLAVSKGEQTTQQAQNQQTLWRIDAGIYLALLVLPLLLWQLQRRAIMLGAALVLVPQLWTPAYAASGQSWFNNAEQNALNAYHDKAYEQAAQARNPLLSGAAKYQQQDYQGALADFNKDNSATGLYNQGNALAQLGKFDEALERYQQALDKDPNLEAAKANKSTLEQLKKQQEQQQNQQGDSGQEQDSQGQDSQQQEDGQQQQQDGQQQGSEQQGESQQQDDSEQQNGGSSAQNERNSNERNRPQNSAQADDKSDQDEQQESGESSTESSNEQSSQQNDAAASPETSSETSPEDSQEQAKAQQQALGEQQAGQQDGEQQAAAMAELSPEEREKAQQLNQLLRKIPDNPEILLRNKMQLEAQQRQRYRRRLPQGVEKSW